MVTGSKAATTWKSCDLEKLSIVADINCNK